MAESVVRSHRAPAGEGDLLRIQLMDAAEIQLAERGMLGLSLRQVARDVGVSPTAVYLHFVDREDLILATCNRRFEDLAGVLREARARHDDPVDQIRACGQAYVRFGLDHPQPYAVMFGGALGMDEVLQRVPEEDMAGYQVLAELTEMVAEAMSLGRIRRGDPAASVLALWALVHGVVGVVDYNRSKPDQVPEQQQIDTALDMALSGLLPRDA